MGTASCTTVVTAELVATAVARATAVRVVRLAGTVALKAIRVRLARLRAAAMGATVVTGGTAMTRTLPAETVERAAMPAP
jgi:hypothetical protein